MTSFVLPAFEPQYIPRGYSAYIQRSILIRAWAPEYWRQPAEVQVAQILARYRHLLDALEMEWHALRESSRKKIQMANCMPTLFVPIPQHRLSMCRVRQLCPWCYSRWVREVWDLFVNLMYSGSSVTHGSFSIVWSPVPLEIVPQYRLDDQIHLGRKMLKIPPFRHSVGHLSWLEILPLNYEQIGMRRRYLGLTTNHEPDIAKLIRPTRLQLAKAFREVFAYPAELLTGDVFLLGNLLNAQDHQRTVERYGILRGQCPDESSDSAAAIDSVGGHTTAE